MATFDIATQTANGAVDPGSLYEEIVAALGANPTTFKIRHGAGAAGEVDVEFTPPLMGGDPALLTATILLHDGLPTSLSEAEAEQVTEAGLVATLLTALGAQGIATLDGGGKVPAAQMPAAAITTVSVVADATARNALTVEEGDEAIQIDDGSHWIYDGASWQSRPTGSGDVTGPASATANALTRFDGTTGKIIKNGPGTLDDSGNLSTTGNISSGGTVDGRNLGVDGAKLDGITPGADIDGKDVRVSANDTTPGFLLAKLLQGSGITLTEVNDGDNEQLRIDADVNSVGDVVASAYVAAGLTLSSGSYAALGLTQEHVGPGGELTVEASGIRVNTAGTYLVLGFFGVDQSSGNSRTSGHGRLTVNGALINGMEAGWYSRNLADGENTFAAFTFRPFAANDLISIEALRESGPVIDTTGGALVVLSLRGPKGDTGPAGSAAITVKNGGVDVPNGPFAAINFGTGLAASDGGGGVADVVSQNVYGLDHDDGYLAGPFTNSTMSPVSVGTYTTQGGLTGRYVLKWSARMSMDATSTDGQVHLYDVDAAQELGRRHTHEPQDTQNIVHVGGQHFFDLTGTAKNFAVRYNVRDQGTVTLTDVQYEFHRVR